MSKGVFLLLLAVALGVAGAAYAAGKIDVPGACDPADTLKELSGQWGAVVQDRDCFDGKDFGVRVIDNDYTLSGRSNCTVFRTSSAAPPAIKFEGDLQLIISSSAVTPSQAARQTACGPVTVRIRTLSNS